MKTCPSVASNTNIPFRQSSVLLYEDLSTIEPGLSFVLALGSEIGLDVACPDHHSWLNMLEICERADDFLRKAQAAYYLVISLRGDRALSAGFRDWLEQWLRNAPSHSSALIVRFGSQYGNSRVARRIRSEVKSLAKKRGIHSFSFIWDEPAGQPRTADELIGNDSECEDHFSEWFVGAMDTCCGCCYSITAVA